MMRFVPTETNEVAVLFEGSAALFTVHPSAQSVCIRSLQELVRKEAQQNRVLHVQGRVVPSRYHVPCPQRAHLCDIMIRDRIRDSIVA